MHLPCSKSWVSVFSSRTRQFQFLHSHFRSIWNLFCAHNLEQWSCSVYSRNATCPASSAPVRLRAVPRPAFSPSTSHNRYFCPQKLSYHQFIQNSGGTFTCDMGLFWKLFITELSGYTELESRVAGRPGEEDGRDQSKLETKVWEAYNPLIDKQIDQFLVVARSVGTFARALDCSSSVRQPSLHMSAAAASRDITLFHAMDTLHKNVYDISKAISALVPQGGPVLCRDEMEEWSASEANLFEEALEKYGKDFTDIQQDFLPWKSLTSIIEYYYMWKTTDRYVQQKRLKAAEAESKLKQVYIPNYNKPNPNQINVNNVKAGVANGTGAPGQSPGAGRACESCYTTQSYQWYSWGPPNMQCRLCASCWTYWKKYGGLKMPTRLDGERPGPNRSNMSPHGVPARSSSSPKFAMKTRQAFYLHTTKLTRIARRLCREILRPGHAARHPHLPINSAAIKAECTARLPEASQSPLVLKQVARKPLEAVLRYLEAHPRPPKPEPVKSAASVLSSLTPAKAAPVINNGSPTILGKRSYEQHNGVDGSVKKRLLMPSRGKAGAARAVGRPGPSLCACLSPRGGSCLEAAASPRPARPLPATPSRPVLSRLSVPSVSPAPPWPPPEAWPASLACCKHLLGFPRAGPAPSCGRVCWGGGGMGWEASPHRPRLSQGSRTVVSSGWGELSRQGPRCPDRRERGGPEGPEGCEALCGWLHGAGGPSAECVGRATACWGSCPLHQAWERLLQHRVPQCVPFAGQGASGHTLGSSE
ncbi:metastasis-associated protein MTA1 isoform X3 [Choloepus didactylus]|uniref:metastasis-associated protein MTA1 isoform X3 n=2 Tax=Choloepus didactylus TaxID=27675 RepID=UPI00189E4D78|nr:metastasis-associated protein MTA1 isoform X3 [Choloepus didactylus]